MTSIEVFNTPRVLLVGSWGSEGLVSAFTDALYRGASWEEALGGQAQELVERRIGAFYRRGHWSVFEFMGAQSWEDSEGLNVEAGWRPCLG